MTNIQPHPSLENCLYWTFDPETGWEKYHTDLDELLSIVRQADNPMYVILHPSGDIPRGNPLPHMKRIVTVARNEPNIRLIVTIMGSDWMFANTFADMINRVFGFGDWIELVNSYEEAITRITELTESDA